MQAESSRNSRLDETLLLRWEGSIDRTEWDKVHWGCGTPLGSTVSLVSAGRKASTYSESPGFHKGVDPSAAEFAKDCMRRHAARNMELMELGSRLFQKSDSS